MDLALFVGRLAVKYAAMYEAADLAEASLSRPPTIEHIRLPGAVPDCGTEPDVAPLDVAEVNAAREALHKAVLPVADDVALLQRFLNEGYPPKQTAATALPDDLPVVIALMCSWPVWSMTLPALRRIAGGLTSQSQPGSASIRPSLQKDCYAAACPQA
jgi:hypothetical protein